VEKKTCGPRFELKKKTQSSWDESDVGPVVIINIGTRVKQDKAR